MHRNYQISKETEDKVKLAKQYIESKYQSILLQEQQHRLGWQRIIKALVHAPLPQAQKNAVAQKAMARQSSQTRLLRVRDRLCNYQLLGMIGKGAFGEVRLAKMKENSEVVAIKRMAKQRLADKKQVSSVFLERQCLSRSRSKWLVQLRSAFQDEQYLYIAMEWVPGGDLLRLLIQRDIFSESQTRFYIAELVLAIEDMHKMNYIHRDIKPDNILIDRQGHLKLTDFGLSKNLGPKAKCRKFQARGSAKPRNSFNKVMQRPRHFSKVGTPDYIAPQILTDQTYDYRVDIWSVGVIMFECLFGYPLFSHEDSKEVCKRVMNWEQYLVFPETPKVSLEAKLLILGMLNSPQNRKSICQIKSHPFFAGFDWDKIREKEPPFVPTLKHDLDTDNFDTFPQAETWISNERPEERKSCELRSSSLGYQYNFAGFDWQPRPDNLTFSDTLKEIESLGKRKSVSPHHLKRLKTEQSQPEHRLTAPSFKPNRNSLKMYQRCQTRDHGLRKVKLVRKC